MRIAPYNLSTMWSNLISRKWLLWVKSSFIERAKEVAIVVVTSLPRWVRGDDNHRDLKWIIFYFFIFLITREFFFYNFFFPFLRYFFFVCDLSRSIQGFMFILFRPYFRLSKHNNSSCARLPFVFRAAASSLVSPKALGFALTESKSCSWPTATRDWSGSGWRMTSRAANSITAAFKKERPRPDPRGRHLRCLRYSI